MWQKEHAFRKANGSTPKQEWAYINFVKRHLNNNPKSSSKEILKLWEIERNRHKYLVDNFLLNVL
jgi:hypothetical protein